jgi:hypothetical protein
VSKIYANKNIFSIFVKENGGKPTGNALLTAHGEATDAIAPTLFSAQQPAQEIRAIKRLHSYTPKENYVTQFEKLIKGTIQPDPI